MTAVPSEIKQAIANLTLHLSLKFFNIIFSNGGDINNRIKMKVYFQLQSGCIMFAEKLRNFLYLYIHQGKIPGFSTKPRFLDLQS